MKNLLIVIMTLVLTACGGDDDSSNNTNQNENQNSNQGVCGDGVLSPAYEECDEGSRNSDARPDACRSNCVWAYCGDNTIDSSEECDHSELSGNTCQTFGYTKGALACTTGTCEYDYSGCSLCGNGVAEGDNNSQVHYEVCDGSDLRGQDCVSVGHASGVLRCSLTCQYDITGCVGGGPVCGNGVVEFGETCDDGNQNNHDACPDGPGGTCQDATCGDGFVWAGHETCDDGNHMNGDLCPDGVGGTCRDATCGDGHVWLGQELCDTGADPLCHDGCHSRCGDGIVNGSFGETCDDGDRNGIACYAGCSGWCGDGIVDASHLEECEPPDSSTCNYNCTSRRCGDGYCKLPEENRVDCPQDCGSCGDGTCDYPIENSTNCSVDCSCPSGKFFCGGSCITAYFNDGPPPICCGTTMAVYMDMEHKGLQNCGACGHNCTATQWCWWGMCYEQE
jgi:cysteine-rich repeat protein